MHNRASWGRLGAQQSFLLRPPAVYNRMFLKRCVGVLLVLSLAHALVCLDALRRLLSFSSSTAQNTVVLKTKQMIRSPADRLSMTMTAMTSASARSPRKADTTAATIKITTITLVSCSQRMRQGLLILPSTRAFGPCFSRRRSTSWLLKPVDASVLSSASESATESFHQLCMLLLVIDNQRKNTIVAR